YVTLSWSAASCMASVARSRASSLFEAVRLIVRDRSISKAILRESSFAAASSLRRLSIGPWPIILEMPGKRSTKARIKTDGFMLSIPLQNWRFLLLVSSVAFSACQDTEFIGIQHGY